MKKIPSAEGWGDPMNVVPAVFAEYNNRNASGAAINLNNRRTTYTKDNNTVKLNPVLTAAQAANYTINNVLSGTDNWKPNQLTIQVNAPVVRLEGMTLKWDDDENVLCWMVFKDNKYYKCVTSNNCDIKTSDLKSKFYVRAANSMGGLSSKSNTVEATGTGTVKHMTIKDTPHLSYNKINKTLCFKIHSAAKFNVEIFSIDGKRILTREFSNVSGILRLSLKDLRKEMYLVKYTIDEQVYTKYTNLL